MAQDRYACLLGTRVALPETAGPLKPCIRCGHGEAEVIAGRGGHPLGLTCRRCRSFLGWLGHGHAAAMMATADSCRRAG